MERQADLKKKAGEFKNKVSQQAQKMLLAGRA
jgi:hypothetical protein